MTLIRLGYVNKSEAETCDGCGKVFHLSQVQVYEDGGIQCAGCREQMLIRNYFNSEAHRQWCELAKLDKLNKPAHLL